MKRPNPYTQTELPSMKFAKRLKRVERVAAKSRPEMQMKTFTINESIPALASSIKGFYGLDITDIAQGDLVTQRQANKIRVWRVEFRGNITGHCDAYLIQNHGADVPSVGDFTAGSARGGYLTESKTNQTHTEWKSFTQRASLDDHECRVKMVQRFNGMIVKYNGTSTQAVQNGLNLIVLNSDASTRTFNGTVRIWYTDP